MTSHRFVARSSLSTAVGGVLLLSIVSSAQAQQEWPGFRGRTGSGVAAVSLDTANLTPEVLWRVRTGSGYSGVAVADGRVLTMIEDGDQYILALDAESGEELWRRRVGDAHAGHDGSWDGPLATPVLYDGLVIGLEAWGELFALDTIDGEPAWSVDLAGDLGAPQPVYGFASSPIVVDGTLVVNGGAGAGTVLGFDPRTGRMQWQIGLEGVSAQAPVAFTVAGRDLVVAAGAATLFGIVPSTGEVVWEYAHEGSSIRGEGTLVPVAAGPDRVFLAHGYDSSQVVRVRGDGAITGTNDTAALVGEQLWDARSIRNSYTVAVYHDGYIYGYNTRLLVCVDAATGELQWRSRAPGDGFPIVVDGHLVILTKDGTLHVARATPEGYAEIAGATVFDALTWTPPSFAYGDVFARSRNEIVRVDLHGNASNAVTADSFKVPRSLDPGDGEFGRFVRAVQSAADPAPLIDAFLARHAEFPLREGDSTVHFVYRGDDEDMAIASDMLGTRQEAPMVRVGQTDLFYYSAELLPDARLSYVFVRENGPVTDPLNPLVVPTMIYNAEREHVFGDRPLPMSELRMPGWREPEHLRAPDRATRGTIEALRIDGPRPIDFQVYLPHGYADSTARYPVVYFHGPAPSDLSALPTSLDNLIADGMRPVIAVWSDNAVRVRGYPAFWAEQLVPAVDAQYRTFAKADGRVGVGGGSGSLAALTIAVEYPSMTSGLALLSIRALDSQWDPLVPRFGTPATRPLRLYIDWGVYGVRNPQEVWDNRIKSAQRMQQFVDLGYAVAGGEVADGVGWASWRNRMDAVLKAILAPLSD